MNLTAVEQIAKAVLYEGYMLYPYRPSSVKNQQRWNFGVLCPESYSEAQKGSEAWAMQTECLVQGSSLTELEVRVRFLQLVCRSVGELLDPIDEMPVDEPPAFRLVGSLAINGRLYQPWQEALEREIVVLPRQLEALANHPTRQSFDFPPEVHYEFVREPGCPITAVLIRERKALFGTVKISGIPQREGIFKVRVQVRNTTPFANAPSATRDHALSHAMASTHTVLGVEHGRFISLTAPPEAMIEVSGNCKNIGTWPVLVGEEGQSDTLLSSPIILYDYPQIAPESPGDLFDGTEIDEILSLRIMTLTDDEKLEMSQSDERARQMLERTETMPVEHLMKLHGVLRGLRPTKEEAQ
jgi:hypothetical protein